MSTTDVFLEIAGKKKLIKILLNKKQNEFIVGSGKDADIQIKDRGLKDKHLNLQRRSNHEKSWNAVDLSTEKFEIKGSAQKRSTADFSYLTNITLTPTCIIRLREGKATLATKTLNSTKVGGMGATGYVFLGGLVLISVLVSAIIFLQMQKPNVPDKEPDAAYVECTANRDEAAKEKYTHGSAFFERVWTTEYYDCLQNAEASCNLANSIVDQNRETRRKIFKQTCPFAYTQETVTSNGNVNVLYFASPDPEVRALKTFSSDLSDDQKKMVEQVCFSCASSSLSDLQRQYCDTAQSVTEDMKVAWDLASANRTSEALSIYRKIQANSDYECEAHMAARIKSGQLR